MRVTVLGKSPSWEDAGGACTGFLVEQDGIRLLLDCGNGVFAKLRRHLDYAALDAVVISHLHADHFLDLVPFSYALGHSPRGHTARPLLFAPPGARATFRRVAGAWGSEDLIESAFMLCEYDPAGEVEVGPLRIAFREVSHFVATHAVGITAEGAGRFVFSADTRPADALVEFASGADLLLCEATLGAGPGDPDSGHLSAREAGEHAARAGVRRLVLTHLTDELDIGDAVAAACQAFSGPVEAAAEGAVYEL